MSGATTAMTTRFDDATATLVVAGEIDYGRVDFLAQLLRPHAANAVVVDLSAVTYLPSAAIGALLRTRRRALATGGSLTLRAAPGTIAATVLHTVGLLPD